MKKKLDINVFLITFSIFYLLIAMKLPVSILTYAGHDDALFLKHAYSIISGHWLGDYNNLTLAKGSGWPIFLSINTLLGIPITLSLSLFYLLACYLLVNFLLKEKLSKIIALSIFVLTLFHPALFPTRIIRDDIYPALTLICFCGIAYVVFEVNKLNRTRILMFGLILGLFVITREEWVWIIPGFLVVIFFGFLNRLNMKLPYKPFFEGLFLFFGAAFFVVTLVCCLNYYKYHVYENVDFKEKEFSNVLKNLNSVEIKHELSNVPVPKERRELIYSVSPAFAELKEYFEEPENGWKNPGCGIYSWACGDYAGGWFMWALRDAVASMGYYQDAPKASAFYKRINNEIRNACDQKDIGCKTSLFHIPFMPNISYEELSVIPSRFFDAVKMVIGVSRIPLNSGPSNGSLDTLNKVRIFLGNPMSMSENTILMSGWFYSPTHNWIVLECTNKDGKKRIPLERLKSEDIANNFHDKDAIYQRFSTLITRDDHCTVNSDNNPKNQLSLKELGIEGSSRQHLLDKDQIIYFDTLNNSTDFIYGRSFSIKNSLITLYSKIIPIVSILGLLAFAISTLSLLMRKVTLHRFWILSLGAWVLVITRLFILALIDITSFPALDPLYYSAVYPLLIIASLLSIASLDATIHKNNNLNLLIKSDIDS